jgi:PAS domain S-box-containing protein
VIQCGRSNVSIWARGAETSDQTQIFRDRPHHLDAFFEHALTPLVLLDRDFNFVRVNEAYARASGHTVSDLVGRNHFDVFPSDARVIFEEVRRSKRPFKVEARPF